MTGSGTSEQLIFGGDYNPEQWPREVWRDDMRLMRQAKVNRVSLGVFSWGLLEVREGVFEWDWLDEILELLHENGIGVNLATPTAAPPSWLLTEHPDIALVDENGVSLGAGGRLGWSPNSAIFRHYALRIVRAIAERYAHHPALKMWHVSNELGNENGRCLSPETTIAWRKWLERRYGDVDTVNETWGTAFWGHRYTQLSEIPVPRLTAGIPNPAFFLDFDRFMSDALLDHYLAERAVLREITPDVPVTTNFMVQHYPGAVDYSTWAPHVDVVANDHYTMGSRADRHAELAFSADRVRALAGGEPWLVMEHAAGAVNWQGVNRAKSRGEMARDTLTHLAHGADGAMFFQWRQSRAGAEQFHSAMVPHAGPRAQIFRDIVRLGGELDALAEIASTRVEQPRIAIIYDHDSAAAWRNTRAPSDLIDVLDLPLAMYGPLLEHGYAMDVIPWGRDLGAYQAVIVPTQYMAPDADAQRLTDYVNEGGHAFVSYFSGIADETGSVRLGGYPGAFRTMLGIYTDEFFPLAAGERVAVGAEGEASLWTERVHLEGAAAVERYVDGDLAGWPAITRVARGKGVAYYLGCRLDDRHLAARILAFVREAGVAPVAPAEAGLALSRRAGPTGQFLFAVNHATDARTVAVHGVNVISGEPVEGTLAVPAGEVRVVREHSPK